MPAPEIVAGFNCGECSACHVSFASRQIHVVTAAAVKSTSDADPVVVKFKVVMLAHLDPDSRNWLAIPSKVRFKDVLESLEKRCARTVLQRQISQRHQDEFYQFGNIKPIHLIVVTDLVALSSATTHHRLP